MHQIPVGQDYASSDEGMPVIDERPEEQRDAERRRRSVAEVPHGEEGQKAVLEEDRQPCLSVEERHLNQQQILIDEACAATGKKVTKPSLLYLRIGEFFVCGQGCEYKSKHRNSVWRHRATTCKGQLLLQGRTHEGIGNKGCRICGGSCKDKDAVRRHRTTVLHTCRVCHYSTPRVDTFKRHLIRHKSDKSISCDIDGCNKTFKTKQTLQTHKKKMHVNFPL